MLQKNTALSKNPNIAIQDVMDSIGVLSNLYIQETDALVDADTQTFISLQEQKFEAANHYQSGVESLLKRKDEMKHISTEKKEQLAATQKEFSTITKQNKDALERMQRCVNRLNGTIRRAAKEAANKDIRLSYDKCGTIKKGKNKRISIGINETA